MRWRNSSDPLAIQISYPCSAGKSTKSQVASGVVQSADGSFDRVYASLRLVGTDLRQEHDVARWQWGKTKGLAKIVQLVLCRCNGKHSYAEPSKDRRSKVCGGGSNESFAPSDICST
jgi:hypothetical protein